MRRIESCFILSFYHLFPYVCPAILFSVIQYNVQSAKKYIMHITFVNFTLCQHKVTSVVLVNWFSEEKKCKALTCSVCHFCAGNALAMGDFNLLTRGHCTQNWDKMDTTGSHEPGQAICNAPLKVKGSLLCLVIFAFDSVLALRLYM